MDKSIRTYLNYLKYYEMYVEKNTEAFPAWALEKKKKNVGRIWRYKHAPGICFENMYLFYLRGPRTTQRRCELKN